MSKKIPPRLTVEKNHYGQILGTAEQAFPTGKHQYLSKEEHDAYVDALYEEIATLHNQITKLTGDKR